jgi:hypothetical protein
MALARSWGMERVWTHLCAMIDWYIYQDDHQVPGVLHRWGAHHLQDVGEQSVLRFYLANWGCGLAAPTCLEQIETIAHDVRFSFVTHSWQSRRQKLGRVAHGARSLARPASQHFKS